MGHGGSHFIHCLLIISKHIECTSNHYLSFKILVNILFGNRKSDGSVPNIPVSDMALQKSELLFTASITVPSGVIIH